MSPGWGITSKVRIAMARFNIRVSVDVGLLFQEVQRAARFGAYGNLVGIVTPPVGGVPPRGAFVFLNAGVVHRVGPNRIYVTAARRLAARGFLSVRFDLSGLGDSSSRRDATAFDQAASQFEAALNDLRNSSGDRVERALIQKIATGYQTFLATDQMIVGALQAGHSELAVNLMRPLAVGLSVKLLKMNR